MKTIRRMGLMGLMLMLVLPAFGQDAPPAAGSALPYLDQALKVNEALQGLPSLPLVLLGALALGYFLKFIPPYKNEWIPFGVVLGALLANVGIVLTEGSGDYIRAVILGLGAGVASIAVHRKWLKDWLDPKIFGVGLVLATLGLGLVGCGTPGQRPPSATEQKYFDVVTNVVPVVITGTNPETLETETVTNYAEQYTLTPNQNASATVATGAAVGSIWGAGTTVGAALLGLFTTWGVWRSRKQPVATAEELAQIIETGRQVLLSLPDGAKYEAAW
jgi:hypothetical protein